MKSNPNDEETGQGRTDGRSLEQLRDNMNNKRDALETVTSTHLAGLSEGFSRRDVLKVMAASFALAGSTGCRRPVENIVPYVESPERAVPGVARYYATTMPLALSAYGLIVKSHEGRPIKIEGNPRHPSTQGASNSVIQAAILGLYDPDRSQSVYTKREAGGETTWDNFVAAWRELEQTHLDNEGVGFAVLSESFRPRHWHV